MSEQISIADLSVLLVEPSTPQRKIIQRHLEDAGIGKIDVALSVAEAVQVLQMHPTDLVISTMYLPDGSSADLVQQIRSISAIQEIPFMLVSSESRWDQLDPVRQAGVVAILSKPFATADLKAALYATLDYLQPPELSLDLYEVEDLRVLVVDDSAMARNHLRRVLEDMGIRHLTLAKDGREAMKKLSEAPFDLIVTDYNMPEMDGEQLTRYIREESSQSHVPILMVTSEHQGARLSSVRQAGISAICDKPFEPGNVRELLQRILNE